MPYKQIGNLNMFYEEFGVGEPVIFLHSAYSRGILAFGGQILPFCQEGYHCYYPDFRGHGRSICSDMNWDSSMLAEDIIRFMDSENLEKVHLIGYSTGGGVAYYMASRYPERVKSLISIGNGGVVEAADAKYYEPEYLLQNNETDFIETVKHRHAQAHNGDWQEYLRQEVKDWRNHPRLTENEWRNINMPMLLIAGENDTFAKRECLEAIKRMCPQTEIFIVKGCGHAPHFPTENVKEINEKMLEFIQTVGKDGYNLCQR